MKIKLIILLLLLVTINATAQKMFSCACEGFVDKNFKGFISLLDKPNGSAQQVLKNNLKSEGYLIFSIDKVSDSFFHVKMKYAITDKPYQGWISRSKYLLTSVRNHELAISLYSEPSLTSKTKAIIPNTCSGPFQIFNCAQSWIYIKKLATQTKLEGWLQSKDQCANPNIACD